MGIKLNQAVSLGTVVFKSCAPIFAQVQRTTPNGEPMFRANGNPWMINSKEVVGTKYNLSCGGLEPRFQDIVVKINGDLTAKNMEAVPYESFEPVELEGIEMNPWGQQQGDFTNINLSWIATSLKSARKGADKKAS